MLTLIFFFLLQEQTDFILIENPKNLLIYDQYKNRLTQKEKEKFPQRTYFEIRKHFLIFEDALTKTMYVKYLNQFYYLGKESEKKFINASKLKKIQFFRNVLLQGNNYTLDRKQFKQKDLILRQNDPVKNIFSTGKMNFFYAKKQNQFFSLKKEQITRHFRYRDRKLDRSSENFSGHIRELKKLNNKIRKTEKALSPKNDSDKTKAFGYQRKGKVLYVYSKKKYQDLLPILEKKVSSSSFIYTLLDSLLEISIK